MFKGLKIVFMLSLVVILSSVAVYFVEDLTTPIIDERQRLEIQAAVEEVFPAITGTTWDVIDSEFDFSGSPITGAKEIKNGDILVGIVYTVVFRGFSSDITYVVGLDNQGTITGYKTISQNDTAGYGAQIADSANWTQFPGLLLEAVGNGGFDGLTGASVTTSAWKQSFADVQAFHASAGVFPELSQADKDKIFTNGVLGDSFVVEEMVVTGFKSLEDFEIDRAYTATDGTTEYAVYFEVYESYKPDAEVFLVVDLADNTVFNFQATKNSDTADWGGVILDSARWAQLEGENQDFLFEGAFDDLGGATTSYSTWQDAMQRISIFHQGEYMGIIRYTTLELLDIYQEQLSVEFTDNTVIEDVKEQKVANLNISNIYDVKDDLGNILGTVYYVNTLGAYNNGPTFIQFLVGVDPDGNYTGLRVLETTDLVLLDSELLITDPTVFDGTDYFADEIVGLTVTEDITLDVIVGYETQIASIEATLNQVGTYHDEKYPLRDDVVIADANLLPAFPDAVSFTTIYSDYTYKNGIVNVYEAYDAEAALLGYVYAGKYVGNNSDILYTIGVDLTGTTVKINVYSGDETWINAGFGFYDGSEGDDFRTSDWLLNFEGLDDGTFVANYTPATDPTFGTSTDIDAVSGVSTTTGGDDTHFGLIDSVYQILKFHTDNSVGGAS
ncbi:Electron transport complex subunit RnfG [Candidatus Izimaplasma bacterium HR1]|jgi:electron transport complex protein RnfG|uniref:FMN-binding protein n=1 Tax=Candidatus Izimoplasma sp. HR1 TaxID=1541959 RepID=UPI0004F867A3|nr:Electron transport complex subunit RnfG [Candidatus Izimaplasma bacterium HR1]